MVYVTESHIVSNLLENLIIFDHNNDITYNGRIITEELSAIYQGFIDNRINIFQKTIEAMEAPKVEITESKEEVVE